jgi:GT2 family glycosyltransferase
VAVVLNHRTAADAILAVRSLQAADGGITGIVLVDNGSGDDSVELFQRHLSGVEILPLAENRGFSDGCNAGIQWALDSNAARILLLNSDVIVPPDASAALHRVLDADRRIGIVGPIVRFRRNPDLVESLGLSYRESSGRMRMLGHGLRAADVPAFDCRLVDAVSGSAMLIRREVFAAIGLLRSDYFFGFEDLDFCCRARAQQFLTACTGAAYVLHEGSRSIGTHSALRAYFATRNHLLLASRFPEGGSRFGRALRLANVLALNVAHTIGATDIPTVSGLAAAVRGARDFVAGRLGGGPQRVVDR